MTRNVFIVDDDEMFSGMLMEYLSRNKLLKVYLFSTGEEALNEISKEPIVAILDYHLNTIVKNAANGLDILKELKKNLPKAHAIMLSSQTKYGVAANSILEGAEQYVMKDETAFEKIHDIITEILQEQGLS